MAIPPVTPTSTVRSAEGGGVGRPLMPASVRRLVLDLVVHDLLERDGEEIGAARGDERRREVLDAHRVLTEAVVVAIDLTGALGRDHYQRVPRAAGVRQELVDAGLVH